MRDPIRAIHDAVGQNRPITLDEAETQIVSAALDRAVDTTGEFRREVTDGLSIYAAIHPRPDADEIRLVMNGQEAITFRIAYADALLTMFSDVSLTARDRRAAWLASQASPPAP